jgi:hypothetical protein
MYVLFRHGTDGKTAREKGIPEMCWPGAPVVPGYLIRLSKLTFTVTSTGGEIS